MARRKSRICTLSTCGTRIETGYGWAGMDFCSRACAALHIANCVVCTENGWTQENFDQDRDREVKL